MVSVGPKGARSLVARVSVVNYYGAVQMDEFVQQQERVVDYRTPHSGIRERDLVNGIAYLLYCLVQYWGTHALIMTALAKSFDEIQSRVVGLLKDKVLVGHAVFNDLQARPYFAPSSLRSTRLSSRRYHLHIHKSKLWIHNSTLGNSTSPRPNASLSGISSSRSSGLRYKIASIPP